MPWVTLNPLVNMMCLFVPGPILGVRDPQMNKLQTLFSGPEGLVNLGSLPLYKWVNVRGAITIISGVQNMSKWGNEGSCPYRGEGRVLPQEMILHPVVERMVIAVVIIRIGDCLLSTYRCCHSAYPCQGPMRQARSPGYKTEGGTFPCAHAKAG